MNLVHTALRRPLTILVLIIGLVLGALLALRQMPRDIFPTLGIPTIYVAQPYGGMDPAQMEGYLTYYYEYHFLYITGIEHVESKSIQGAAILKLQFHPGTDMSQAMSETVAYVNRARAFMPPGTVPPFVMRFDAGSVPVGDLVFSSTTRTVGEMQDLALNRVRPLFATLPGVSAPPPFGGSARSIVVNLKPERLRAYNMSPDEVVTAITAANLISPSGNMPIQGRYPMVPLNSVARNVKDLEAVPIRTGTFPTVFLRDVGQVVDGSDIVTSYALVNGHRTVYIPVTKRSTASTLSVVNLVKANLAKFQSVLPADVKVSYEFDQSPYVTRAIGGLTLEGALGAVLTGLMVLLFLQDWRSALIVVINIPISLMGSLLALWLTGQTINIMTLGGLALAVGILVDEATVSIENIHTHLTRGRPVGRAALDATTETTVPRLLAMLCILAIFIPTLFMVGAAKAMFLPLSLAVGFAMVTSYLLSSTLVPILSVWVLRGHETAATGHTAAESRLARFQGRYAALAQKLVAARWVVLAVYLVSVAVVVWFPGRRLGTEIFPKVDAGQIQLRLRAPTGTQIDGTEAIALQALDLIQQEVGPQNVQITLGFLGVHSSPYPINFIYLWNGGPEEGVLQVQLKPGAPVRIEASEGATAKSLCRKNARRQLLLRTERHRQPGHEPRFPHAHRDSHQRPKSDRGPGVRRKGQSIAATNSLPARPPVWAGAGLSHRGREGGSGEGRGDGRDDGRRVARAGHSFLLQPLCGAQLLGRPEQRRGLSGSSAGAPGADGLAGAGEKPPGDEPRRPESAAAQCRQRDGRRGHRPIPTLQYAADGHSDGQRLGGRLGRRGPTSQRRASMRWASRRPASPSQSAARAFRWHKCWTACAAACCWRSWSSSCCWRPISNPSSSPSWLSPPPRPSSPVSSSCCG